MSSTTSEAGWKVDASGIVRIARSMLFENKSRYAYHLLKDGLEGIPHEDVIDILMGIKTLRNVGREVDLIDGTDEEHIKHLDWMFQGILSYKDKYYQPKMFISNYGWSDIHGVQWSSSLPFGTVNPCDRAKFYGTKEDVIFLLKVQGSTFDFKYSVIFEPCKGEGISDFIVFKYAQQDPQKALDAWMSHHKLIEYGHSQYVKEFNIANPKHWNHGAKPQAIHVVVPEREIPTPKEAPASCGTMTGYIDRQGTFYPSLNPAEALQHRTLAESIGKHHLKLDKNAAECEDILSEKGWLKVGGDIEGKQYCACLKGISQAQRDTLFDYCQAHKLNFNKFIADLH